MRQQMAAKQSFVISWIIKNWKNEHTDYASSVKGISVNCDKTYHDRTNTIITIINRTKFN